MHRQNKKEKMGLLLIILLGFIFNPTSILAKGQQEAESTACKNQIYGSDSMLSAEVKDTNNYTLTISAKKGKWNIKYYLADEDELDYSNVFGPSPISPTKSFSYTGGSPQTVNVPRGSERQRLIVVATLSEKLEITYDGNQKTTCKKGSIELKDSKVKIEGTGAVLSQIIKVNSTRTARNLDPEEQAECDAMVQGKYKTDLSDHKYNLDAASLAIYNNNMARSFPYCYNSSYSSSFDVSATTIKKVRQSSIEAFKIYRDLKAASKENSEYETAEKEIREEGYKFVPFNSSEMQIDDMLTCSINQTQNETKKYYTRTDTQGNNICKVTCQEQLQVTYGPPVAVKAGLCFEYEVTIKSKVTCKTEIPDTFNWPEPPSTCGYTPICSNNESETQAGPNEDFDNCISACDNGEYSQKCINSCYKKVYESKKTTSQKKTSKSDESEGNLTPAVEISSTKSQILPLANKNDPYYQIDKCKNNKQIYDNRSYCAEQFYKLKQKYPVGYYSVSEEKKPSWADAQWIPCGPNSNKCEYEIDNQKVTLHVTKPDDIWKDSTSKSSSATDVIEDIKRAGPYYFATKQRALKTIESFWAINSGTNGYGQARHYIIDNHGVKRQSSSKYKCHETCGYNVDDDSPKNSDSCIFSDKKLRSEYTNYFNGLIEKLSQCTSNAKCDESTDTFKIHVDNPASDDKNQCESNNHQWTATNQEGTDHRSPSGDILIFTPTDGDPISPNNSISESPYNGINGKCYGYDGAYWHHYKTTITFPGSWINLKTGEVVYADPKQTDQYRTKENYFCTLYNSCDVNEEWWKWKVSNQSLSSNFDPVYNIDAEIDKFGKYNWKVSLQCFYALYNQTCEGDECNEEKCYRGDDGTEESCTDGDDGDKLESTKLNYDIRIASLESLFPNDRLRGYNWGSAATLKSSDQNVQQNLVAGGYNIDPVTYSKQIMKNSAIAGKGEDGTYTDSELDFRVTLSTEDVNFLKGLDLDFSGTYNKNQEIIPGLYPYTMDKKITDRFGTSIRKWEIGTNNK